MNNLNRIKNELISGFIILILIFVIFNQKYKYKKEISRVKNNYEAIIKESSTQQEITKKEYKEYYVYKLDSLTSKLKIKSKNIQNVIVTKYNYKDTIIKKYETIYNPIEENKLTFITKKECSVINGETDGTYVTINKIEVKDNLTTFIYKEYRKKFLFIHWKPYYNTKVYSKCKNDTISVQTNIKIVK